MHTHKKKESRQLEFMWNVILRYNISPLGNGRSAEKLPEAPALTSGNSTDSCTHAHVKQKHGKN